MIQNHTEIGVGNTCPRLKTLAYVYHVANM